MFMQCLKFLYVLAIKSEVLQITSFAAEIEILMTNDKMEEKEDHMNLKIQKFLKNCYFARIVNEWLCGTLFKSKSRIGW